MGFLEELKGLKEFFFNRQLHRLRRTWYEIKYIPKDKQTEEMAKIAVSLDGFALAWITEKNKTDEICDIALKNNLACINDLKDGFLTEEKCIDLICDKEVMINEIPEKFYTPKFVEKCIELDKPLLRTIMMMDISEESLLIMIKHDSSYISNIPITKLTQDFCDKSIKTNKFSMMYIPKRFLTKEVCYKHISNVISIDEIPKEFIDEKMVEKSIKGNPFSITKIPEEFLTQELCDKSFNSRKGMFEYIPLNYQTKEMVKSYREETSINIDLDLILEKNKDEQFYEDLVSDFGGYIDEIPSKFKNNKLCLIAVKLSEENIEYIPKNKKKWIESLYKRDDIDIDIMSVNKIINILEKEKIINLKKIKKQKVTNVKDEDIITF